MQGRIKNRKIAAKETQEFMKEHGFNEIEVIPPTKGRVARDQYLCVICSKRFTVNQSKKDWFEARGLDIPKRCEASLQQRNKAQAKNGRS